MTTNVTAHSPVSRDARSVAERTLEFFAAAAADAAVSDRLARSHSVVHVHLGEDVAVTLRLDRSPVEAESGIVGHADASVWCTPAIWEICMAGGRPLAMAIVYGDAEYSGHVREVLAVLPILRTLDRSVWRGA